MKLTVVNSVENAGEILNYLYSESALTWCGVPIDDESLNDIEKVLFELGLELKNGEKQITAYAIKGGVMNEYYYLTGENQYHSGINILAIPLGIFEDFRPLIWWRFGNGARWFDDIVDSNEERELLYEYDEMT